MWHVEVSRRGIKLKPRCWPTPQPEQRQIQATSATYTAAHSDTGSLTHCARPGIEPTTSWFLVGFISTVPRWELLTVIVLKFYLNHIHSFFKAPFQSTFLSIPLTLHPSANTHTNPIIFFCCAGKFSFHFHL